MFKYLRTSAVIVAVLAVSFIAASPAKAQEATQAITVSPASTELSINAGESVTKTLDVINGGNDGFNVSFSTAPYHVVGDSYDPKFTQLPGTLDASQWVSISDKARLVEGLKVLTTTYTVSVPAGTPAGGYYAVIFAEASQDSQGGGVVPRNRVGNILYITVNGTVKKSGFVTAGTLPNLSFSQAIPMSMKVANDGGVHFVTNAQFIVKDFNGKEVFKANYERFVLPTTERLIETQWEAATPFGIYTIQRQATAADKTVVLDEHRVVIISPWFLISIGVFLATMIALIRIWLHQRKKEK